MSDEDDGEVAWASIAMGCLRGRRIWGQGVQSRTGNRRAAFEASEESGARQIKEMRRHLVGHQRCQLTPVPLGSHRPPSLPHTSSAQQAPNNSLRSRHPFACQLSQRGASDLRSSQTHCGSRAFVPRPLAASRVSSKLAYRPIFPSRAARYT